MTTNFADLGVPAALDAVLAANGITTPTPIQAATLPDSLAGKDLLGRGRTGSGKTYAFALPVVARLSAKGGRAQAAASAPRADPRADPRARQPDRRRPQPARQGRRPQHPHRLRRRRPGPAGLGAQARRRHPHRLPRPARGPDRPGSLRPRRRRRHRARRGRPHGRPGLPARRTPPARADPAPRPADALLRDARQRDRRAGQALPRPARRAPGRLRAVAGLGDGPPRPARLARAADRRPRRPRERARPHHLLHPHQARREGAGPPAQQERRAGGRPARQPQPGRAHAQPRRVPQRYGDHAGRDRHRRSWHPRRRRRAGRPRRPAGRAQGLPAPLRPHRARRRRRHRHHADDRRSGPRRPRPDPRRRSEADHHQARQRQPPGPAGARPRRAPHPGRDHPRGRHGSLAPPRQRRRWHRQPFAQALRPARRIELGSWRQPQRRAEVGRRQLAASLRQRLGRRRHSASSFSGRR